MTLYRITAVVSRRKRYIFNWLHENAAEARCHWFAALDAQFVTVEEVKE